ncbi:glycine-rich RNA-binding protein RZ1C isoform X2 [Mangifera indica]|nr:glycine-rich RNA-binding protein RZ1C isoform X2 [Mangifera indica]
MMERDSGRPRGFGFVTFADRRAMEDAIREMHGREFGERIISVNKAQPKMGGEDVDRGYRGGYPSGDRRSYGGDRPAGQDECFKCGRPGHWARDCPSAGGVRGGVGGKLSSRSRYGGTGGRGYQFGGGHDRYMDGRYDGGHYHYGDRDHYDSRDSKYGGSDIYANDRYQPGGDRGASDRYGGLDRYPHNGYGRDGGNGKDDGPRGGSYRYGNGRGPARDEGRSYRNRAGPYDRPNRGDRLPFDRY